MLGWGETGGTFIFGRRCKRRGTMATLSRAEDPERLVRMIFQRLPSPSTRESYLLRWRTLLRDIFTGVSLVDIMSQPRTYYPALMTRVPNGATRRNLLAAIASAFKHGRGVAQPAWVAWEAWRASNRAWMDARVQWQRYLTFANATLTAEAKRNLPSARQALLYTSYDEVGALYRKLAGKRPSIAHGTLRDSLTVLMLSYYQHQVPKRADLGDVRIFRSVAEHRADRGAHPNYLLLGPRGDTLEPTLVIGEHKTAAKQGELTEPLEPGFVADLRESLQRFPRDTLFVADPPPARGAGAGNPVVVDASRLPPMTANQFTHFVRATFKRLVGRATGPTMLRHAFINERISWGRMSEQQLEELARRMGHTTGMQRMYKWTSLSPAGVTCECTGKPTADAGAKAKAKGQAKAKAKARARAKKAKAKAKA